MGKAWLAYGMSITVMRDPNSFFISFRLDSGLKGSFSAANPGAATCRPATIRPALTAATAARWLSGISGVPSLQPNGWIVARREECKAQRGESAEIFLKNPDDYAAYLQTDAKLILELIKAAHITAN